MPSLSAARWVLYQILRFFVVFTALLVIARALGVAGVLVSSALYGLTLRYDYWSNGIEFLAASLVLVLGGTAWLPLLGAGLVLGAGRETLPLLALVGSPGAIALAAGGTITQVGIRRFVRTEPHWEGTLEYASPMWVQNWDVLRGKYGPDSIWYAAIWLAIGVLSLPSAPWLAGTLLLATFLVARIDEPRTLTMLIPWAALTIVH